MSAASNAAVAKPAAPSHPFGANAPSVLLPLRFMMTGLLALFSGGVLLVARPEMLAAYHYNQYVIAATHLFVLGWIMTIVMGAMYQLVPVALETRLYSERLARVQFLLHLVGFGGMVWMFWTWNMKHVGHFGSVLAVGVGLFLYNIVRTLWRVPRWNVVATSVAAALGWLSAAVLAGLTITAGKCSYDSASLGSASGFAPFVHGVQALGACAARFDQLSAMHAHAHLGAVGLFLMLIIGISYKLVPMFTLSELQSRSRARLSLALLNGGLLTAFITILTRSRWKWICALLIVSALVIYGIEIRAILRARKRRVLDWGVIYFLTALALLAPLGALGLVLAWPGLPLTPFTGQLENLYGFLGLLGFVSLAIIGMLYKILPFLVWYRSYSHRIGVTKVPALADLYSATLQVAGYWCYLMGLAVLGTGILLGQAATVRLGAAVWLGSLAVFGINVAGMMSHLFRPRIEPLGSRGGIAAKTSFSQMAKHTLLSSSSVSK